MWPGFDPAPLAGALSTEATGRQSTGPQFSRTYLVVLSNNAVTTERSQS